MVVVSHLFSLLEKNFQLCGCNPFINEQNVAASADTRVHQHGFCESMNGLDTLKSIQPHS